MEGELLQTRQIWRMQHGRSCPSDETTTNVGSVTDCTPGADYRSGMSSRDPERQPRRYPASSRNPDMSKV